MTSSKKNCVRRKTKKLLSLEGIMFGEYSQRSKDIVIQDNNDDTDKEYDLK